MGNKRYLNIAIGLIALLALGALALAIYANYTPAPVVPVAAQPAATAKFTPTTATVPATSPATLPGTATATKGPVTAPTITVTPIITLMPYSRPFTTSPATATGKVATDQQYPWAKYWPGIKVVRPDGPPIVSQEVALRAMLTQMNAANLSIVSDTEVTGNGTTISYRAFYGLVTDGGPGPDGSGWAGSLNIRLSDCAPDGKCKEPVTVLDHIENRLMWLFDLEIMVPNGGLPCPAGTTCAPPIDNNHQVNMVDAKTLTFIGGFAYYQP